MSNKKISIAIIVSDFHSEITDQLLSGSLSTLIKFGIDENNIKVLKVPGAIEIPLIAKFLAMKKKYDAIICLGAVIRGETSHYEYVCQQVSHGCQKIMLEFNIPIIFGVLTTENLKQAKERSSEAKKHKGIEAAHAAINMIALIQTMHNADC